MIAGFNTDIEYGGTVYHVQTEDKGAPQHMVMSLVYDKGTILASKRTTYEDLSSIDFDESQVAERVSRQHKLMCAAVMAGRVSELVEMTRKASVYSSSNGASIAVQDAVPSAPAQVGIPMPSTVLRPLAPTIDKAGSELPLSAEIVEAPEVFGDEPAEATQPVLLTDAVFEDLPIIDAVTVIEDIDIIPAEAVQVVSEMVGKERRANEKLTLELLGETKFKGGDRKTINLMLCRGTARKVVPGAQIIVKVLGSAFRPVIFHARSDVNGLAKVHLQLPKFSAGRAALLIRALNDGEEIELRKAVTPG